MQQTRKQRIDAIKSNNRYCITPDNKIYRYRPNKCYWLLVSPWTKGENRVVYDIKEANGLRINSNKAQNLVNTMWAAYNPVWEFEGKHYTTVPIDSVEWKDWKFHFDRKYQLVMYNGTLKWRSAEWSHYYPRTIIYNMNNGKNRPKPCSFFTDKNGNLHMESYSGWVNFHHLKLVKCIETNEIV